jgi:hypothetical protein
MSIAISCPCGKTLTAPDEAAGQRVKCPACGVILDVAEPTFAERMQGAIAPVAAVPAAAEPSFAAELLKAFAYPISLRGAFAIVGAALVFALCFVIGAWLPMPQGRRALGILIAVGALVAAYLCAYIAEMVRSSAGGEPETPDWPDLREFAPNFGWIVYPLVMLFVVPTMLIAMIAGDAFTRVDPVVFAAVYAAACLYLPMALVGVLLLRSFLAVSPHVVAPAALRAWPGVLVSAALLWIAVVCEPRINARLTAWAAEHGSFLAPLVGHFVANLAVIYLLLVAARVAGVSYWVRRREIGWFRCD